MSSSPRALVLFACLAVACGDTTPNQTDRVTLAADLVPGATGLLAWSTDSRSAPPNE